MHEMAANLSSPRATTQARAAESPGRRAAWRVDGGRRTRGGRRHCRGSEENRPRRGGSRRGRVAQCRGRPWRWALMLECDEMRRVKRARRGCGAPAEHAHTPRGGGREADSSARASSQHTQRDGSEPCSAVLGRSCQWASCVSLPHLHVFGHNGDAASVEGAQVGVWRAQHEFATHE